MRRNLWLGGLAALLIAPAGASAQTTVKVGMMMPYSGPVADVGQQLDRGVDLFLRHNPTTPKGNKVELIKRDTTGPNPEVAKRLATELVTRDRVSILAGIIYSNNAFAVQDVCDKAKVPFLIMNAGTASITEGCQWSARTSFTMWQAGFPMGDYAFKKMNVKTAAIAYANYAPGKDSTTAFKRAFERAGGKVVLDVPFPYPQMPDFTPFMQRIKDAKPDAVYIFVPAGKWATNVMKTYGDLGMERAGIKLIGPGDIVQDSELGNMGDVPLGVVTVHHYSAAADRPENKLFVQRWKEAYGKDSVPDFLGVQGWDGMAALYHVIDETAGKVTPENFIAAMKTWRYNSPRGPMSIDPETRDVVNNQYVRRVEKRDGALANIEFDTIPMVKDPWKAGEKNIKD